MCVAQEEVHLILNKTKKNEKRTQNPNPKHQIKLKKNFKIKFFLSNTIISFLFFGWNNFSGY